MTESQKGLRITAGILLLILACFSLASSVSSLLNLIGSGNAVNFATVLGQMCLSAASTLLSVIAAILILARRFSGAGVMRCLMLALSIAGTAVSFFPMFQNDMSVQRIADELPTLLIRLADLIPAILIIIALFLHSRRSMPLLIVAVILALLLKLTNFVQLYNLYKSADVLSATAVSLGINGTTAAVSFVAWILLAVYFGAQQTKQKES